MSLAGEFRGGNRCMEIHVAKDVDGDGKAFGRQIGVKARAFFRSPCVEIAATSLDRLRYGKGRPFFRALEQHVLYEVRNACIFGTFMSGSARDEQTETYAFGTPVLRIDDTHAIGQCLKLGFRQHFQIPSLRARRRSSRPMWYGRRKAPCLLWPPANLAARAQGGSPRPAVTTRRPKP